MQLQDGGSGAALSTCAAARTACGSSLLASTLLLLAAVQPACQVATIADSSSRILRCCSVVGAGIDGNGVRDAAVLAHFRDVIEEGEEAVVVALGDGIELVVVTVRAFERESQPGHAERAHAIGHVLDAILFVDDAAFGIDDVIASETGGDALLERWDSGSRSPANCSVMKRSYGMLLLKL